MKRAGILTRLPFLAVGIAGVSLVILAAYLTYGVASAADTPGEFSLQVTPSPLVTTIKPGTKTTVELKIRNAGNAAENLKIEPRSFTLGNDSTNVNLLDTVPPDIASWITFSQPQFTIQPGQWMTEQVTFNVPENAGFSYSFALVINRQEDPQPTEGGRLIKGSVAVFTLVNIDRPDATSNLTVNEFSVGKKMYEYLPATFSIRFNNTGNTIVQPYGNIFIERAGGGSGEAVGSLAVNGTRGYILPETERTITADWTDGFPSYETVQNEDGTTSRKLKWDWTKVSSLRIGRYTAKLVAVYNQGGRDVPIEGTVSFWVVPWKILLVLLVIVLLLLFALFMLVRMIVLGIKRRRAKRTGKKPEKSDKPE